MSYDHVELALSRLTSQFEGSPNLRAMLAAMIAQANVNEADGDDLRTKRWLDTAEGQQLDGLGNILVLARLGRNDDDYREALRFKVFVNISKATPPDINYALKYLTQADDCQYVESWPATVFLYTNGYHLQIDIADVIQDLAAAGISDIDIAVSYGEKPLRFSNPDMVADDDSEFGGLMLPTWNCLDGKRMRTINGKNIRVRGADTNEFRTARGLTGLFEVTK